MAVVSRSDRSPLSPPRAKARPILNGSTRSATTMRVSPKPGACAALLVLTSALGACSPAPAAVADGDPIPVYEIDPTWPPELPNKWILGQIRGLFVDENDHLWVIHMPSSLGNQEIGASLDPPISECCVPAPPVLELDPEGNVVQTWG